MAAVAFTIGGSLFALGGYASLLLAINEQSVDRWRWWSYDPSRIDWLSAFVLFVGTLAFGVSLLASFLDGLTTQQVNRLIWSPEVIGGACSS